MCLIHGVWGSPHAGSDGGNQKREGAAGIGGNADRSSLQMGPGVTSSNGRAAQTEETPAATQGAVEMLPPV